jgi:arsenate reductase (thioredoxin)
VITVLFACVQNAGRSQIAAALFNKYADAWKARAISAGTQPGSRVHPEVVEAMRERGIELSSAKPQQLTPELASTADWLITMGCGDECPIVPGARRDDWPILDPKGQSSATVNAITDDIDTRVRAFIAAQRLE